MRTIRWVALLTSGATLGFAACGDKDDTGDADADTDTDTDSDTDTNLFDDTGSGNYYWLSEYVGEVGFSANNEDDPNESPFHQGACIGDLELEPTGVGGVTVVCKNMQCTNPPEASEGLANSAVFGDRPACSITDATIDENGEGTLTVTIEGATVDCTTTMSWKFYDDFWKTFNGRQEVRETDNTCTNLENSGGTKFWYKVSVDGEQVD